MYTVTHSLSSHINFWSIMFQFLRKQTRTQTYRHTDRHLWNNTRFTQHSRRSGNIMCGLDNRHDMHRFLLLMIRPSVTEYNLVTVNTCLKTSKLSETVWLWLSTSWTQNRIAT